MLCTEYMARPSSTFNPCLGILKDEKVAAYCWGFVSGKTQTIYSWKFNKMDNPTPDMLKVWFHDILYSSGIPYNKKETDYIKKNNGKIIFPDSKVARFLNVPKEAQKLRLPL